MFPQLGSSHPDGKLEVGVVGDHYSHFVVIFEAVQQQVAREIDVRTLLLGVEYLDGARAGCCLLRQGPTLGIRKKMPVVDAQVRDGLLGTEISLLTLRLIGVFRAVDDFGGEVSYSTYVVFFGQQEACQLPDIQPAKRRTPQGTIVKIEAVNIDIGTDE